VILQRQGGGHVAGRGDLGAVTPEGDAMREGASGQHLHRDVLGQEKAGAHRDAFVGFHLNQWRVIRLGIDLMHAESQQYVAPGGIHWGGAEACGQAC